MIIKTMSENRKELSRPKYVIASTELAPIKNIVIRVSTKEGGLSKIFMRKITGENMTAMIIRNPIIRSTLFFS